MNYDCRFDALERNRELLELEEAAARLGRLGHIEPQGKYRLGLVKQLFYWPVLPDHTKSVCLKNEKFNKNEKQILRFKFHASGNTHSNAIKEKKLIV